MLLKKSDAKRLAKSAQSITRNERDSTIADQEVSYETMLEELKHCSTWSAEQYDNTIFMSGTAYSFTVLLLPETEEK